MGDQDQWLWYRPAQTIVKLDGAVAIDTDESGNKTAVRTSDVQIGTGADPRLEYRLIVEEQFGRDRKFAIRFDSDERLLGTSDTTTGVGAQVVQAGVRLVSLAAKAAALILGILPEDIGKPVAIEDAFEEERPDLAERRKAYKRAIDVLQRQLATTAQAAAQHDAPPETLQRLTLLRTALQSARAEAALLQTQFDAWRSARYPTWTQTFSYALSTDELPVVESVKDEVALTLDDLPADLRDAARTLGAVVVRVGDGKQRPDPRVGDDTTIRFRIPRRVQLAVYVAEDGLGPDARGSVVILADGGSAAAQTFVLRSVMSAWIVDALSDVRFIQFRSGLFEAHGTTVDFGDAGTLTRLSNTDTSAVGSVAGALSSAGAQAQESVEQATKIAAAFPASPDPALNALKDNVTRAELEAKLAVAKRTVAESTNGAGSAPTPKD